MALGTEDRGPGAGSLMFSVWGQLLGRQLGAYISLNVVESPFKIADPNSGSQLRGAWWWYENKFV